MSVDPKTITVFLDATPSGARRATKAARLAKRWNAHLVGAYVVFNGVMPHPSMAFARSEKSIAGVVAHERRLEDACECTTAEVGDWFRALCAELGVDAEFRPIDRAKTVDVAIINSLHSDLIVVGHPAPSGLPDDVSAEKVLLASGVPLLILPNDWAGETVGEHVVIGWNASPEARRAVSDSMSLLVAAKSVTALIVDPQGCRWLGEQAGCDLRGHLSRHGANVVVEEVASRGRAVAKVILERAVESGCDLIVVGARNPAHVREILFGNATRTLLTQTPVPVLISR